MDSRLPPSLAAYMAELERRIKELESSPRLSRATITGYLDIKDNINDVHPRVSIREGKLWVLDGDGDVSAVLGGPNGGVFIQDEDGNPIATFGPVNTPNQGVMLHSGGVTGLHWDTEEGLLNPYEHVHFRDMSDTRTFTNTSHADAWSCSVEMIQSIYLKVTLWLYVDTGTVAEVRLQRNGGAGTTTVTHNGDNSTRTLSCYWEHGGLLNSGPHAFNISVRRVSGTGNVSAFTPHGLTLGNYSDTATTSGAWVGQL